MATTKDDLVKASASAAEVSIKDAERVISAFIENVQAATIAEGKLTLMGFGTFKVTEYGEREGRNPATGDAVTLAPCKVVRFSTGKAFKDKANASLVAKKKKAPAKEAPAAKKAAPATVAKKKIVKK